MIQNREERLFHAQIHLKRVPYPFLSQATPVNFMNDLCRRYGGGMEINMENQQNQDAPAQVSAQASSYTSSGRKPSGNRNQHGRNRGYHHRPTQQRPSAEDAIEAAEQREQREQREPKAPRSGTPAPKSNPRGQRGRGKGGAAGKADTSTAPQSGARMGRGTAASAHAQESEQKSERGNAIFSSASNVNDWLFDGTDRLQADSFLPLHEEHKPDPEAEQFAAAMLDAEGPLLFSSDHPSHALSDPAAAECEADAADELTEIVGIRFRKTGKVYFFDPGQLKLSAGSYAVVETARGLEYGEVARGNTAVPSSKIVPPLRPVIRAATQEDTKHHEANRVRQEEAFRICLEKIAAHDLEMKLIEAEYTFDNTKLLFYFTAAGRVDFRELVKDLAGVFRTRIELRQIGIRDEARLLGGLGTCGRPLCCASFLADFVQVSIKMAKEQSLSLNSTKISGCCGRLMCCLRYESDTYEAEIRRTPTVGSLLQTSDGNGTVVSINPLRGTVRVRMEDEAGTTREYHRDQVRVIRSAVPADEMVRNEDESI